jgi:amino acid transporter
VGGHRGPARSLGLASTIAIGIGGMVGGGIFAVLGLSVVLARGAAPVAFLIAGTVALLTAASYARLSVAYPSRGGTATFLNQVLGDNVLVGGLNVLLWLSYVVMLSLYAAAFASYAASLLPGSPSTLVKHALLSAVIVAIAALNLASAAMVGRAERWIVALKLLILGVFIATGLSGITWEHLGTSQWADPLAIIGGGMLIFVAYEGFELIANAAEDVRDPERNLPRALFASVGIVIVLYVLVAVVTVGTLTVAEISRASDYALAEAARPALGQAGFVLVAIAAMLSTTSAINATMYGTARLSWTIARSGELPEALDRKVWNQPVEGLLVTTVLTLIVGNAFDLSRISVMGSAGFLIVFAAVNVAAAHIARRPVVRVLAVTGAIACTGALAALIVEGGSRDPWSIVVTGALVAGSFGAEAGYRRVTHRSIHVQRSSTTSRDSAA